MSPSVESDVVHPAIGTLIDQDTLELVEILGVGGYGVVYRAIETVPLSEPISYAVKCLVRARHQTARQRQVHIREITLHHIASAHPGVVTLHRVVETPTHTYIIMDYAPHHDLFTQILSSCRYLGDDLLIKDVFLQLLDAVEYCHSLGIYHRDLKPENVLCFDDGVRVAITDFGLATTEKFSDEFRTGSVYHMSPECQGGTFARSGNYSPLFNDIWSLGIILLNLATGRNPWKSATMHDPTFQAYLRDPIGFLPSVLPISYKLNDILVHMLDIDWRERMTLRQVRCAVEDVQSFYDERVVFEGSMARCPWELGMDIDTDSSDLSKDPLPFERLHLKSQWSKASVSEIKYESHSVAEQSSEYGGAQWAGYSSCVATWDFRSSTSVNLDYGTIDMLERSQTMSDASLSSHEDSQTATSQLAFSTKPGRLRPAAAAPPHGKLTINTDILIPHPCIQGCRSSSPMQTTIDDDPWLSLSLFSSSDPASAMVVVPDSAVTVAMHDKGMSAPSSCHSSSPTTPSSSWYFMQSFDVDKRSGVSDLPFNRSWTPCLDVSAPTPAPLSGPTHPSQPFPILSAITTNDVSSQRRPARSNSPMPDIGRGGNDNREAKSPFKSKTKSKPGRPSSTSSLFNLKLPFPRSCSPWAVPLVGHSRKEKEQEAPDWPRRVQQQPPAQQGQGWGVGVGEVVPLDAYDEGPPGTTFCKATWGVAAGVSTAVRTFDADVDAVQSLGIRVQGEGETDAAPAGARGTRHWLLPGFFAMTGSS